MQDVVKVKIKTLDQGLQYPRMCARVSQIIHFPLTPNTIAHQKGRRIPQGQIKASRSVTDLLELSKTKIASKIGLERGHGKHNPFFVGSRLCYTSQSCPMRSVETIEGASGM